MIHAILVIPQEYINVTEIETYSLRGILEWGKRFYIVFQTLCLLNSYFQFIRKTLCERNTILSKYYPKIALFN